MHKLFAVPLLQISSSENKKNRAFLIRNFHLIMYLIILFFFGCSSRHQEVFEIKNSRYGERTQNSKVVYLKTRPTVRHTLLIKKMEKWKNIHSKDITDSYE